MDSDSNESRKSVTSVGSDSSSDENVVDEWIRNKAEKASLDLPQHHDSIFELPPTTQSQVIDAWINGKAQKCLEDFPYNRNEQQEDTRSTISASSDGSASSIGSRDSSQRTPSYYYPTYSQYESEGNASKTARLATSRLSQTDRQAADRFVYERAEHADRSFSSHRMKMNQSWINEKAKKAYNDLPGSRQQSPPNQLLQRQETQVIPSYESRYNDILRQRQEEANESRYYNLGNSPEYHHQQRPRQGVWKRTSTWFRSWIPKTRVKPLMVLTRDDSPIYRIQNEYKTIETQRNNEADSHEASVEDLFQSDDYNNDDN